MSTTVTYKGSTLTTVNNQTRVLETGGTWLEDDITLVDVTQGGITPTDTKQINISQNGTVTEDVTNYASAQITVNVSGGGTPSQTQHTILFEFEDSTTTSITAYWDGTFISDAVKATTPTTYDSKTVQEASLDGVAWYTKPTGSWETIFENNANLEADDPYPYFWIAELADVVIPQNSVWRITFDGTEYVCTAERTFEEMGYYIGNAGYGGGSDDGTPVPLCLYNTPWGAWSGGANASAGSHTLKIEKQVTS